MALRLAGGVVPGPGRRIWTADSAADLAPGTPVAVGPRSATDEAVGHALAELDRLVAAAGVVAAGADVELGPGFRSARVDGGAGDRRDGVLAALMAPGFADRLGDRLASLVALFGPAATKPLGAATQAAVDENRWAALRFAVAASDVLGPEQLVRLVSVSAPAGIDPFPDGLPSVVGGQLVRVLRAVPRPRRLDLLTDLWHQVGEYGLQKRRRERLRASQGRQDRTTDLVVRYARYEEDELRDHLRADFGAEPTLYQAAMWRPSAAYWLMRATRVLRDAMAATVLARLAVSAVDYGAAAAVARHRPEIEAVLAQLPRDEAAMSARVVPGLTGLPARPGSYLKQIGDRLRRDEPLDDRLATYVSLRLAHARDYGIVALRTAEQLIDEIVYEASIREDLAGWTRGTISGWRRQVGYFSEDRLGSWDQPPLRAAEDQLGMLAERLRAEPDRPPGDVETIGDMFWYAELADALAQLHGHPAAEIALREDAPHAVVESPEPYEPLIPRPDSIALAVAGTAQLVDLGGTVPQRCRAWPELVAGLLDGAAVAEALTGAFAVPPAVAAADGAVLPGTDARIEVARTGRQLAEWSAYMGNCIAGTEYIEHATAGRAVLVALQAPDGRLLANADLRSTGRGWRLLELKARFNADPDPVLRRGVNAWIAGLPGPEAPEVAPPVRRERPQHRGRPAPVVRLARDLGAQLGDLAATATAEPATQHAFAVLAALLAEQVADPLTALRRASAAGLVRAWKRALPTGPSLVQLWQATGDRPLERAIAGLPAHQERLAPLLLDAPLPGSLRKLARQPGIAPARTAHLVAVRLRGALGALIRQDAPELARAVHERPPDPLIRAAALAVTSWGGEGIAVATVLPRRRVRLPGFPASTLTDEGWRAAWPAAVELGGSSEGFWDHIAAHGLLLPASWLPGGGWPALWSRAARQGGPGLDPP